MAFATHWRRHGRVHLGWTIAVLAGLVIGLASLKLGTDDSVKDILNFAVALASLVLALLAIIQALLAGGELTSAVNAVEDSVAGLREPTSQLTAAAAIISGHSEHIGLSASSIQNITEQLLAQRSAPESSVSSTPAFSANDIIPRLTASGAFALYVCLRSFETQKPIPSQMAELDGVNGWLWGYINALANLSLIGISRPAGQAVITDLGPFSWLGEHRQQLRAMQASLSSSTPTEMLRQVDELFGD